MFQDLYGDLLTASPEILLALGGMLLLMIGVFSKKKPFKMTAYGSMALLVLVLILLIGAEAPTEIVFSGLFRSSPFTIFSKIIVAFTMLTILFMTQAHYKKDNIRLFESPVLLIFATLGMFLLISAHDLIALFIGLELQSLCIYVLVASRRENSLSSEAGLKYFILGALATALYLYGASLVYGYTGTTDFQALMAAFSEGREAHIGLLVGIVLIVGSFAFKLSLVPFHMWTPDVYEGSPTPITVVLASAPKVAAFALILQVFHQVFASFYELWSPLLIGLSVLSMSLGALTALFQTNIKRLLAYSTITHMGYAVLGLLNGRQEGVESVLLYLLIYVVMTVGVFACLLNLRRQEKPIEDIYELAGLSRDQPFMAASLAVFMFSLAGNPPLAGFFAKLNIFMAAVKAGYTLLAVFGVVASVVAAAYYLKIIKIIYFDENPNTTGAEFVDKNRVGATHLVMGVSALSLIFYAVMPSILGSSISNASKSLLGLL